MTPPELPSAEALRVMHAQLIARFGGAPGIRDPAALEAALARPLQILAFEDAAADVPRLAAAVAFSICRIRHPFADGNKRAAFAALVVTLGLNNLELDSAETEAAEVVQRVADGRMSEAEFTAWVATRCHLA